MSEIVMIIFTGVIAISTIAYTYFSYRLWKSTRASVDLARYSAFLNLLMQLDSSLKEAKSKNLPESKLLEQMTMMISEFGFDQMLGELNISKDKEAGLYFAKIEGILRGNNIDPQSVPWFRPIARRLEQK